MTARAAKVKIVTWSAGSSRPGQRGFTLLELLVVLVIAALMLALVAPNLVNLIPGSELKAFAQQSAALLRELRSEALNGAEPRALALATEERRYQVPPPLQLSWPETVTVELNAGNLPGQPVSSDVQPQLVFYPDGSSNGGSLTLGGAGNRHYRIMVDAFSGRVHIDD